MALGPLVGIRRAYLTGANPPGGGPSCRTGMSFTLAIPGFFLIIASVIFTDFQMLPIPILLLLPLFVRFLELFFEDVDTRYRGRTVAVPKWEWGTWLNFVKSGVCRCVTDRCFYQMPLDFSFIIFLNKIPEEKTLQNPNLLFYYF